MKINLFTQELEDAIKKLDMVRPTKAKIESLTCIHIVTADNKVILTSTDLVNDMQITLDAEIIEHGEVLIGNIDNIKKSFKYFKDSQVTVEVDSNNNIILTCSGKQIKNTTIPTEEFPQLQHKEFDNNYTYNTKALSNRINKIIHATIKDETRPMFTGIHFNSTDMVAVDGYRIALNTDSKLNINAPFTINNSAISVLKKILNNKKEIPLEISTNKEYARFEFDGIVLNSRLLDVEYIKYNQVIPREHKASLTVNTSQLLENAEFLNNYQVYKKKVLKLEFSNNKLKLNVNNSSGIYKADTDIIDSLNTIEMTIGLDNDYIIDALKSIDDKKVSLHLGATNVSPLVIIPNDNELYMILPVKISA